MTPLADIPPECRIGPFRTCDARRAGLSRELLRGRRFRQLFRGVWVLDAYEMSPADWIRAARLAMPGRAQPSHLTRVQMLGLDFGPVRPFHFTVTGDLHLTVPDVYLHRTKAMPPTDDDGVTPTAAYIGFCATTRTIDAIGVGDWLLHHGHMTSLGLRELAHRDRWRPGAVAALWVARHLSERSASLGESEFRAMLEFSGLPAPEINARWLNDPNAPINDALFREWHLAAEIEGEQHFSDPDQIKRDIWRYAWMRDHGLAYAQVTRDIRRHPRALMRTIHRKLTDQGYGGPNPIFGRRWSALFGSVHHAASSGGMPPNPPPLRG